MTDRMIVASGLSFRYPGNTENTLSDLSFELQKGSFAIATGATGTGKSTLLKLLIQEEDIQQGTIEVCGISLGRRSRDRRSKLRKLLGLAHQDFRLLEDRTVRENLLLPLQLQRVSTGSSVKRLSEISDRFQLDDLLSLFPRQLSLGESQRVQIARAVIKEPYLLIVDEPTASLDEPNASRINDLLFQEHLRGMTILVTTSQNPTDPRFLNCQQVAL